ncbi:MAG: Peptidase C45 acyl-coenzyme A:6-aminopenicillanic acid acyl-transferase [candidate division WS6 bacterium GW2011_GWA2_37_6]|uniref:Peptidase C45 acyl-coenzyme A:6-aminopenicillanic acid acyl-transferase n=1 Tax=candidate division WS6 bacterium GW2011_GWA2_37_6 TaxID=1619087 RepID=A0A0G0GTN3_9BACT|nr:MAG: Peptidase C45 acyl-coenzyme A:6-aminopenicillanic acid acyl-transferase [candidate division WS6 bacterium GW2011_GWA2_37_6]
MDTKTFKGNFFEIGQQQGKIYKTNGMNFDKIKIDPVLYKNQLQVYQKHYPELLEELSGIAQGGHYDGKKLIYHFITSEILYFRNELRLDKACTIFGYKSKNDLFVGRNYDWIPETDKIFEVYKVINPDMNSFIAVTDMGIDSPATAKPQYFFYNADDAINNKGLFIGLTFAYADQWSYGISCIHMTRIIAETCETVEDALKVFKNIPLCCPKNFFIADKKGNMVIVEHTSKKFRVVYPNENILIQTNHYVDNELSKEDTVLKRVPFHNTFIRYYETLQKIIFERDKFNINSIVKILGRPGSYTCQNFPGIKTIWTLALDMSNEKYNIYWNVSGKRKTRKLEI